MTTDDDNATSWRDLADQLTPEQIARFEHAEQLCMTGAHLATLRMTPMRMRRMRLEQVSSDDAEWLRSKLEHVSRRFGTRVETIDGVLTVRA